LIVASVPSQVAPSGGVIEKYVPDGNVSVHE